MSERIVHHGRNVKRIREIQGIKQEALAIELGEEWNQKKISLLENKEVIDDDLLDEVAKALKITPDAIKNFNEESAINFISSNFHDNASIINTNCTLNINPIDKWLEALEENKKLYERLLQAEKEKVALLEKLLEQKK
ncbi:MAG: XRE family transcriptional regulator [Chitinophagaceae bacterium]|nr:MAG: XRE family transcriptional regulator [Chitinophagaceae bacterium]